jgi:hypothetical protein
MFVGLRNLHLSNGTIKFSIGCLPIRPVNQLSTIHLTDMKLVVVPGSEAQLAAKDANIDACILEMTCLKTLLILESCTLEATFDSPALDRLVGCRVKEGAQVGLQPWVTMVSTHLGMAACLQLSPASAAICLKRYKQLLLMCEHTTMPSCYV